MNKNLLNAICTPLLLLALTACTNNEEVNNVQDMPQSYTYDIDITVGNDNNSATPNSAKGGCVKIDTSSYLLPLYLVYHIIRYLLQLCC